jgi:hypothetical protein
VDSAAFPINVAASDPGIITLDSTGSGQGAILHYDATSQAYTLNSSSNKMPKTDTTHAIMIFATGLGAPTSTASNAATAAAAVFPTTCISALGGTGITGYMQIINAMSPAPSTPWTSIDGAVIVGSKLTANHYPPCLTGITVTINGVTAPVTYAGFVSDSVAGLYQINATLPASLGTVPGSGQVPVVVSVGTAKSQNTTAGTGTVYMYVQ